MRVLGQLEILRKKLTLLQSIVCVAGKVQVGEGSACERTMISTLITHAHWLIRVPGNK